MNKLSTPVTYKNIDEYIASQPINKRATLEQLRQIIKQAAPEAEEVISYQLPAFKFHGMLVYFSAFTNHYGIYFIPEVLQLFKNKLKDLELTKSTIKIPINKPLPEQLITEIVMYAAKFNLDKMLLKKATKRSKK